MCNANHADEYEYARDPLTNKTVPRFRGRMISLKKYLDSASGHLTDDREQEKEEVLWAAIRAYRSALHEMGSCCSERCSTLGAELKKGFWELKESLDSGIGRQTVAPTGINVQRSTPTRKALLRRFGADATAIS